ncbi:hypothetical protein M1105_12770 [Limibaculum sp. FT325]|uniref:hypothetical protein n=1 Tax=Thermohalobaculum sediminis TaxID=2939436 RepID=UPI0020BFA47B|nr:hypothetical protein [Limibaculum sediminis]MCL5777856.1 hypothetical protein [Limibaculum sediminis]
MGEYLVHSVEGFTGLAGALSGKGREGFDAFLASPSPWIMLGVAAIIWLTRRRR